MRRLHTPEQLRATAGRFILHSPRRAIPDGIAVIALRCRASLYQVRREHHERSRCAIPSPVGLRGESDLELACILYARVGQCRVAFHTEHDGGMTAATAG